MKCPICRRNAPPPKENPFHPFCSERCKLVDLGKWLGEEYRVPGAPARPEAPAAGDEPEEDS